MPREKKKTQVEEMDRGIYDIKDKLVYRKKTEEGLTEEIVRAISEEKNEPDWMLDFRLKALEIYYEKSVDMDEITTYIRPDADLTDDWRKLPDEIADTFDRLGIPEAEKNTMLSGVGAQYDSEVVYHNLQ